MTAYAGCEYSVGCDVRGDGRRTTEGEGGASERGSLLLCAKGTFKSPGVGGADLETKNCTRKSMMKVINRRQPLICSGSIAPLVAVFTSFRTPFQNSLTTFQNREGDNKQMAVSSDMHSALH